MEARDLSPFNLRMVISFGNEDFAASITLSWLWLGRRIYLRHCYSTKRKNNASGSDEGTAKELFELSSLIVPRRNKVPAHILFLLFIFGTTNAKYQLVFEIQ